MAWFYCGVFGISDDPVIVFGVIFNIFAIHCLFFAIFFIGAHGLFHLFFRIVSVDFLLTFY